MAEAPSEIEHMTPFPASFFDYFREGRTIGFRTPFKGPYQNTQKALKWAS